MYYATGRLVYHHPQLDGGDIWLALFTMLFGALTAGEAFSAVPNRAGAVFAALKIFTLTETPTAIDPLPG